MSIHCVRFVVGIILLLTIRGAVRGEDWPMWRYDAGHRAASPENLPAALHLQWVRCYGQRVQVWDDPLNNDLMPYDKVFEPVVADGRMFVGFNDRDKVVALDINTGEQLWEVFTDGPVRLPPVVWQGGVYFTSDDGCLWCCDAATGEPRWKFRGGPSARKVLGNGRLISAWPARGGPVIRDGTVYFAASIWPFMGTFIYALDAESGEVEWVNDCTGSQYILQPHSALSFAGVAPQGALVATEEILLVPGGRSVPAAFDRRTGAFLYFHLNAGGKGNGGSLVIADEAEFFVHTRYRGVRAFDLPSGSKSDFTVGEPVLADGCLYAAGEDGSGQVIAAIGPDRKTKWTISADGSGDVIKAGGCLYAAGQEAVTAIKIPAEGQEPEIVWSHPVEGQVLRLLAAEGKLFAVTLTGRIMAFGDEPSDSEPIGESRHPLEPSPEATARAKAILARTRADEGYALGFGVDDALLEALLAESELHVVVVEPDGGRVDRLRRRFDAAGLYGRRVAVHQGRPAGFQAPPYMANLIVLGEAIASQIEDRRLLESIYESVRPYGGSLWLPAADGSPERLAKLVAEADLAGAKISAAEGGVWVVRQGRLPGAADWTHQYGDVANTVKSNDRRVRLPLGLLWFGGSSNLDVLPRHGHGPPEQVVGGRLFIEGMDCLSARDVYTGRPLWKVTFENLGNYGVYFNDTYADTPLSIAYNQKHIPGANGRGTNFVATPDAVYVVLGDACRVLDPKTGETLRTVKLPQEDGADDQTRAWGYVGVYEGLLLAGNGFAHYSRKRADPADQTAPTIEDLSASDGLVAFDRHTGQVCWKADARFSFLHNGIVAGGGRVYCLDKLPKSAEQKMARRGEGEPSSYRIVAFDAGTGETLWQVEEDVFGTWLGYSQKHDVLLQAGAKASDRLKDEVDRGMIAYRGKDGSVVWKNMDVEYSGPCILHHETIITNADQHSHRGDKSASRAFSLLDGSPRMVVNPLTGNKEPWQMARGKGCSTILASEHLLMFRDGAGGYYDLRNPSGRGSLGGFKSGCTSNLVAADGVVNAPDYTRTCSCAYQNQTSLALVHMPEAEVWTVSYFDQGPAEDARIKRVGINLGAPGDRRSADGTLWLEYPTKPDTPPLGFEVTAAGEGLEYSCRHASAIKGSRLPWVAASAARNIESLSIGLVLRARAKAAEGIPVADGNDDAEESPNGKINLGSSDLELVEDKVKQVVGVRFNDIQLRRVDELEAAFIQFTTDEVSEAATRLTIRAEAADDAAAFLAEAFNISSRPTTESSVSWDPPPWPKLKEAGPKQRTPDLASLVREVVGREGWKSGNSLVFTITGEGKRVAKSSDGSSAAAPRLFLETSNGKDDADAVQRERPYTVRLVFAEHDELEPGERVFDVFLQGEKVLAGFDVAEAAGATGRGVIREFRGVPAQDVLKVDLKPLSGQQARPVLCGVEIIAEQD